MVDGPFAPGARLTGRITVDALLAWAKLTGTALVVATHDPGIAESFDAIWRIDRGRLETSGHA